MTPATLLAPTPERVAHLAATVARDDLLAALRWASVALPAKSALPVLAGARLHAASGGLTVTVYDYETCSEQTVLAPGAKGTVLVPARQFSMMLATLPKGADIVLRSDGERLSAVCGEVEMGLPLLPISEWPTPAQVGEHIATFTGADLQTLARSTVAAGRDDCLPVLTGVLLEEETKGKVISACTDRYRLAVASVKGTLGGNRVLVPARVIHRVGHAFGSESAVEVYLAKEATHAEQLTMSAGGRTVSTRLLDGEFPKFRSLIKDDQNANYVIEREVLLTAIRQAATAVKGGPVHMDLNRQTQYVTSNQSEKPATSDVHVTAKIKGKFTGEALRIAFNPTYAVGGLHAFGSEQVNVAMAGPRKPAILSDPDDDAEAFIYLVMPVRIAD